MNRLILLVAIPLFTWTGVACFVGIWRFNYPPLAILGTGYLTWVVSFVLMTGLAGPMEAHLGLALLLVAFGAVCIFGYRFTFYMKMKALGITPKRIFGFGASK